MIEIFIYKLVLNMKKVTYFRKVDLMKRCKKCVMPDTKPGVVLDEDGICQACRHAEKKTETDWDARFTELRELCNKYRRNDGYYDCIVTVSGGKDSHFQIYLIKEILKMNPLLINVGNFSYTEAGRHNFDNMGDTFGCDIISLFLNRKVARNMFRKALERLGSPTWYWDRAVYVFPIRMAINLKIPLIIYGENISYEYGGVLEKETYSAMDQINNDVVKDVGDLDYWLDDDITIEDLNTCVYPSKEEIKNAKLEPIYLSYFVPWDGYDNYKIAKKYGFKTLDDTGEWDREGYVESFDQIDTIGYLVHPWFKYPKFGIGRPTEVTSYWLRGQRIADDKFKKVQWTNESKITREEALKLVEKHDHKLDPLALKDFLEFTGYSEVEFWEITKKFINPKIWEKIDENTWQLKDNETKQILKIPL